MKAPVTWLREFADLPESATVEEIGSRVASVGFEVAGIEGDVIDFEVTANRPDCLSIRGLAREAATAYGVQGSGFGVRGSGSRVQGSGSKVQASVPVTIESPLCGRYALALADVTVGPSPTWLADRLTACGIRPINNVVDITNYVLLEIGQPMHAFDVARLAGPGSRVRMARAGETLTTLDRQARTLDPSMLVIADAERAVAIAGVMGGATSEVSASTTRIALESAWFRPEAVRAASKRLGLKTEASARFERGADPAAAVAGLERALELLEQIGAGRQVGGIVDVHPAPPAPLSLHLQREYLDRLLGDQVPEADVMRILTGLRFSPAPAEGGWLVGVPSWRVDVARPADLIEEVGRHWGVNRVPARFPSLHTPPHAADPGILRARRIRRLMCGAGLQEAATFTFLEAAAATPFVADARSLVKIANPLSEKFAVLRPSILPGLIDALIYNRRRDMTDVRLFEAGSVFSASGEQQRVAWVLCGARTAHWSQPATDVDLYDALGVAEILCEAFGLAPQTDAAPSQRLDWFVGERFVRLSVDGRVIGTVSQVRSDLLSARGLSADLTVVAGEMDVAAFDARTDTVRRVSPLPRHPAVVRDLSMLVDARLPAAAVRATIRQQPVPTLVKVHEFDRYQGKGVPEGQVSLSVRLTFQDRNRTLTDGEVQDAVETIVKALTSAHGATLRSR